jgi:hypothetical protein
LSMQSVTPDQCQGGPGADHSSDDAVSHAVCQVGADGGDDADTKAPLGANQGSQCLPATLDPLRLPQGEVAGEELPFRLSST